MAGESGIAEEFVMIDDYLIDVSIQEDHSFESEVTDYPVESGGSFSDNIRPKPITVTMQGIVSNSPLTTIAAERAASGFTERTKVASMEAYALLTNIVNSREPVTIRTSLGTFERMALTSLTIPRSKDTGDALHFTASFQQIQAVTNNRVKVRTSTPGGKRKKDMGQKASTQRETTAVLWRKGAPPGSQDIFVTQVILWAHVEDTTASAEGETLVAVTGRELVLAHSDVNYTRLTQAELVAYRKDAARDAVNNVLGRPLDPNENNTGVLARDRLGGQRVVQSPATATKAPFTNMSKLARQPKPTSVPGFSSDNFITSTLLNSF